MLSTVTTMTCTRHSCQRCRVYKRMEVVRNLKAFRGEPEYYQITEMYFADREPSTPPCNPKRTAPQVKTSWAFAREVVTMVYGEVED